MTALKFVDELPPDGRKRHNGGRSRPEVWQELRQRPGKWAEVRRYPVDRGQAARSAAFNFKSGADDIETTSRITDDALVVYARAVPR